MSAGFISEIRKMAEDVVSREGCYLYDLEFVGAGSNRTLRVTIDKEMEGGASIEDCSKVSRGLNQVLDADEDVIPGGNYQLEVSTPGLERVLKEPRHFEKAIGKKISVKAFAPLIQFNENLPELGIAKQVQGKLISYDETGLRVSFGEAQDNLDASDDGTDIESEIEAEAIADASGPLDDSEESAFVGESFTGSTVFVPFESLTKAHLVFEFAEPAAKKKPAGQKKKKGPKKKKKK